MFRNRITGPWSWKSRTFSFSKKVHKTKDHIDFFQCMVWVSATNAQWCFPHTKCWGYGSATHMEADAINLKGKLTNFNWNLKYINEGFPSVCAPWCSCISMEYLWNLHQLVSVATWKWCDAKSHQRYWHTVIINKGNKHINGTDDYCKVGWGYQIAFGARGKTITGDYPPSLSGCLGIPEATLFQNFLV